MKTPVTQRILAVAAGCLITVAAAGTAGAAPLPLQPTAEGPAAPVAAAETGSFERALGGDVGFSVSQGSSDMYWNVVELVLCDLMQGGSFLCNSYR
ncbi:hypothetical protein ACWDOP_02015 [Nocardia sp. NPDC003693]